MAAQRAMYYFRVARKIVHAVQAQHLDTLKSQSAKGSGSVRVGGDASLSSALHVGRFVPAWAAYEQSILLALALRNGKTPLVCWVVIYLSSSRFQPTGHWHGLLIHAPRASTSVDADARTVTSECAMI